MTRHIFTAILGIAVLSGVLFVAFIATGSASAKDMDFTLQEVDLRPKHDLYQWIFADGDIIPGTANRFKSFIASHPQLLADATVTLNSPGGSPIEGMLLGEIIRNRHFRTAVGRIGPEIATELLWRGNRFEPLPGQCLSACIYPYLGGEYRYLTDGSAIGIHRFKFSKDVGGEITSEISQELSGMIVDYIKKSRADPSLFVLMTQTPPDRMSIIPRSELKALRVVTDDIFSENWIFEIIDGNTYLKADQITWRGRNKLLFICAPYHNSRVPALMAMTNTAFPAREVVIAEAKKILIFLDGKSISMPSKTIAEAPRLSGDSFIRWMVFVTPQLAERIKMADQIGSGISPGPEGTFAGFAGINVGDGRRKIATFFENCN